MKKENIQSALQRISFNMPIRPKGKLIWLHAASIGESLIAITLVRALIKTNPKVNYLITTGTLSSAKIINKNLPKNVSHQFRPIDNFFIVRKFLANWRPNLGIFIESEIWPCLIDESSKKFPLILVNARLSDTSYIRWKNYKVAFQNIVNKFHSIFVQSKNDLNKYHLLGCDNVKNLGNLKFVNQQLQFDVNKLDELEKLFIGKKIFVAGSTHQEDEEVILRVIRDLKEENINYYPIIVLRHPERKNNVKKSCKNLGLNVSFRSDISTPLLKDDLYIVDSLGELGLFYKLSFVSFVGGSFKHGGHNLLEPACFNNIIIFGSDMSNFQNIADDMLVSDAAIQISNSDELKSTIKFLFDDKNNKVAYKLIENSSNFIKDKKQILTNYLLEIEKLLK